MNESNSAGANVLVPDSMKVPVPDSMKMLYEHCRSNIEFAKRQQWQMTNYALLLDAAIVGITELSKITELSNKFIDQCFLIAVALLAAGSITVAAGWILAKLQCTQAEERKIQNKAIKYFPKEFCEAIGRKHSELCWHHGQIFVVLVLVVISGFIAAFASVWEVAHC